MYEIVQKRRNERTDLLSSFKIDSELGRQIPLVFSNSYNGKTESSPELLQKMNFYTPIIENKL
jgi:hypothetical protein